MIGEAKLGAVKTASRTALSSTRYSSESIGRILFGLYCLDAAVDFHSSEEAGNTYQVVMGSLSCLAFILFALNARRTKAALPRLRRVTWLWWIYLASTPLVAYMRAYGYMHYLRVALPQFLMGTSLIMGYILLNESRKNSVLIFKGLFYCSLISTVIHLIQGLTSGYSVENLRYFIASPLLIIMVSFSLYRLIFEGARSGLLNLTALTSGLGIVCFTVTRTFYASLASILLSIAVVLIRPPAWLKRRMRRRTVWNLLLFSAILGLLGAAMVITFPDVLSHWSERSSTLGTRDATTLIRISEAAGEIETMESDTSHLLLGSGLGSEHKYDERFLIGVSEAKEEAAGVNYSPGHVGWIYQFYASGLLLGWVFLFVFAFSIWKGNSPRASYVGRMAGIALIAVFVTSTFGNMLGERSGGLVVGFLIALALYSIEGQEEQKTSRIVRAVRMSTLPAPALRGEL
ncbi:hypothetical protein DYQ86_27495 [Acidobacteria bacterium AB60]|nr:hypothetical protein DYQ86_27495 [Acidobacteria bacterium AB60]